jgi:hypothetical protein
MLKSWPSVIHALQVEAERLEQPPQITQCKNPCKRKPPMQEGEIRKQRNTPHLERADFCSMIFKGEPAVRDGEEELTPGL